MAREVDGDGEGEEVKGGRGEQGVGWGAGEVFVDLVGQEGDEVGGGGVEGEGGGVEEERGREELEAVEGGPVLVEVVEGEEVGELLDGDALGGVVLRSDLTADLGKGACNGDGGVW